MLARMVAVLIVVGACNASQSFAVTSVTAVDSSTLEVVYSDVPDQAQAEIATNYSIPGLTVHTASSAGDATVRLETGVQTAVAYALTVANVTRASDGQPLATATTTFAGRSTFNLVSAAAVDGFTFTATFDAAPDPTQAIDKRKWLIGSGAEDIYSLSSVTLTLNRNTVTFSNAPLDVNRSYSVWVQGVHRRSDGEPVAPPGPIYFRGISAYFRPSAAVSKSVFAVGVTF